MPGGRFYHNSCIASGVAIEEPCPYKPLASYYSDWTVYAQSVAPDDSGFTYMSSTFTVPSIPLNHGPAKQSSVYIFNGLEDGGGVHGKASVILQPVLQYGKSGCLLNPAKWSQWYISSYVVDGNGRAHCASTVPVEVGDVITGKMEKSASGNVWNVTTFAVGREDEASVNTVDMGDTILDAAYATMEGMVVYTCDTYPGEGRVEFTDNVLRAGGKDLDIKWKEEVRHDECGQAVEVGEGGDVALVWDPEL